MRLLLAAFFTVTGFACATSSARSVRIAAAIDAGTSSSSVPPAADAGLARDPSSTVYEFEGVEVFGSRRHPRGELLETIGMPPPGTRIDLKEKAFWDEMAASKARLTDRYRFIHTRYNLVALPPTGKASIAVDVVDEGDAWRLDFLPAPTGSVPDPAGLLEAWQAYDREKWALRNAGLIPTHGEGTCRALACVSDFGHPKLAVLEEKFIADVPGHHEALVRVLREDKDELRRMTAASLLVYGKSRTEAVSALLPSVRDPAVGVRNEVLRSLGELQHRQAELVLPVEPIVDALWYPSASDRNKAGWALVRIVEATGNAHQRVILERGGEILAMMAGAHTATDHEPAGKVLEAISGQQLGRDEAAWRAWLATQGVRGLERGRPEK